MHFLVGAFIVFLLWESPVTRLLLLTALVALLTFSLLPVAAAVAMVMLVAVASVAGAVRELAERRAWRRDDEMLRRAAVRRARRYLDES